MASSVPLTSKLFLLPPFPPFSTSAVASAAHSSPPSVSSARVLHVQNGNPHHTGIAHLCSSRTGRVQSCNCDGDGDGHCNGDNDDDGHMLDTSDSCAAPASSNSLQLHRGYTAPCWPHILSDFSTHLKKSHVEQQHFGNVCQLEGFCAPFGRRVRKYTFCPAGARSAGWPFGSAGVLRRRL